MSPGQQSHPAAHAPSSATPCPASIPRSYDNTYNFTSCSFENFNGWADAADEVLRAQGVPVDSYKYRWGAPEGGRKEGAARLVQVAGVEASSC